MHEKKQLRKILREMRDKAWTKDACKEIQQRTLHSDEYQKAQAVLLYYEIGNEVEMSGLLYATMALDRKIAALPVITPDQKMELYVIEKSSDILPVQYQGNVFFVPDSRTCRKIGPESIDLCIVPGLGFDVHCNRLGYGSGLYDRLLSECHGMKIGVALDAQILNWLPVEKHDVPMDKVITEQRILTR
ncbi:5-formyltetrahydrofolate cyclo-ligase [Candidatus Woesearchaeota archaeon]|nr:5-formyltetrahydrofolate cyclo-ligase [Candidatus Woesearchaeota archaeon]